MWSGWKSRSCFDSEHCLADALNVWVKNLMDKSHQPAAYAAERRRSSNVPLKFHNTNYRATFHFSPFFPVGKRVQNIQKALLRRCLFWRKWEPSWNRVAATLFLVVIVPLSKVSPRIDHLGHDIFETTFNLFSSALCIIALQWGSD